MVPPDIKFIDEAEIKGKTVLLRVDFNVSMNPNNLTIADDARIRQAIPTIQYLLKNKNNFIIVSHLARPKGKPDPKFSMRMVTNNLQGYLPNFKVRLINDFLTEQKATFEAQTADDVLASKVAFCSVRKSLISL